MTLSLQRPSMLRWCAGGLIAALSLLQALRTLAVPGRAASLGGMAILALSVLTVVGLVGLLQARLRIERELLAMRHEPPGGALIGARRERLAAIAAVGARPDADALAEEAATNERGRAYLGRYLVAVAVLIGLVGTFSGLADALRALPAIFNGASADPARLAELMRSAMTGLDLTFAAGIVGILSTLSLSLVQGDLQVHEERALARLEEVTAHELVPALWPRRSEDRVVEELAALRDEAASVRILVGEVSQTIGSGVADALRAGLSELRNHQAEAMKALTTSFGTTTDKLAERLAALTDEVGARAIATHDLVVKVSGEAAEQIGDAARAFSKTTKTELEAAREALTSAAQTQSAAMGRAIEAQQASMTSAIEAQRSTMASAIATQQQTLGDALEAQTSAIAQATDAQVQAVSTAVDAQVKAMSSAVDAQVQALASAMDGQVKALASATDARIDALSSASAEQANAITAAAEAQATAITVAAEAQAGAIATSASAQSEAFSAAFERQHALVTQQITEQRATMESALEAQREALASALTSQTTAIETASLAQAESLAAHVAAHQSVLATAAERQAEAVEKALSGLVDASLGAFSAPAAQLSEAAVALADAQRSLTPQLESLAPELRALSAEVALLGAKNEVDPEPPLFADELVRLGEGMSRLEALVQMSQSNGKRKNAQG